MNEEAHQRLLETIENALAAMAYRPPGTPGAHDAHYDAAAAGLQAALQAAGFEVETPAGMSTAEVVEHMRGTLGYGIMAYKLERPRGRGPAGLAEYHSAVAASVLAQLVKSGWSVDEGAVLRKAPPKPRHSTAQRSTSSATTNSRSSEERLARDHDVGQALVMSDQLNERLATLILAALTSMPYRPPDDSARSLRDRVYDNAATCIFAAIEAGFQIEGKAAAPRILIYSIRNGVVSCRSTPPIGRDPVGWAQYHAAVAACVMTKLTSAGWEVEPPATLRKLPFRESN